MEANEMEVGPRDQGSQALQEFQGRHDDMGGAIAVRGFEFQHDVALGCAGQAFVAQSGVFRRAPVSRQRGFGLDAVELCRVVVEDLANGLGGKRRMLAELLQRIDLR